MTESLTSINGKSVSDDQDEPFENSNAKEALPDSSTGNDAECTATSSAPMILCDGNSVSVNDDKVTGSPKKLVQKSKEGISGETMNGISADKETTLEISNGQDSLPGNTVCDPKETITSVKKRFRRAKTFQKLVGRFPRRAINGHLAPAKRRIRRDKGLHEELSMQEEKSTNEEMESELTNGFTEAEDLKTQTSAIISKVPKRGKQAKIHTGESLNEQDDAPNLNGSNVIFALKDSMDIPQVGSIRKKKGKRYDDDKHLSHFQIMQKCLNKKALYNTLLIDGMYECPICHVRKKQAQYLLLHLKGHSDLTQVFERYQTLGGSFNEMEKTEAIPIFRRKKRTISNAIEPTEPAKTVELNLNSAGEIADESAIVSLPVPEAEPNKKKRRRIATSTEASTPQEDEVDAATTVSESEPIIHTAFDPPLVPVSKKVVRRKRAPFLKIARRWPVTIATTDQAKRTRSHLGVSHMDAIAPDVLLNLKREIKKKVTPANPHNCKYCGKIFFSGTGIYAHYSKHARLMSTNGDSSVESVRPINGPSSEMKNGNSAFDALLSINMDRSVECSREEDFLTLQELETNVNQLLRNLVKDTDTLRELGWPERRVSDLVIDILERCSLQPSYCGPNQQPLSKLQCLRKNMSELFRFCIKEQAMEKFEWNTKLVDIVVREMLAYDKCLNLSTI